MSLLHKHPQWAAVCTIYQTLKSQGYQALLAGGCVRDALLGRSPQDLDVATNASPEVVESLFEKTVSVGKSFGVIRVLLDRADIEVATFRTDGEYKDGRHPEKVVFSTPEEDAFRRDFTINALFLDPGAEFVLDFVDGQKDLRLGVLRAVGDPEKRFQEDRLRILRAVRFVGQLGFEIEPATFLAIQKMSDKVHEVSPERITEEMTKLLRTKFRQQSFEALQKTNLMQVLFPFRAHDLSFINIPTKDLAKLWSLFFLPLQILPDGWMQLRSYIENLRFSNKDKKFILDCFSFLNEKDDFFKKPFGEKLLRYSQDSVRWGCQILSSQKSQYQIDIEGLQQNWLYMEEKLPECFVTGHDLSKKFTGREIGEQLQEVYIKQLEGKISSRDEALDYLDIKE